MQGTDPFGWVGSLITEVTSSRSSPSPGRAASGSFTGALLGGVKDPEQVTADCKRGAVGQKCGRWARLAEKSNATITELSVSGSALASVLIDGEASGKLDTIKLRGGDQAVGIVQQHFVTGAQPSYRGGTPWARVVPREVHPVPVMPVALLKNL